MRALALLAISLFFSTTALCDELNEKIIRVYQDADLSRHKESSAAIQKGIELAFDKIDNVLEGYKVEFKYLDHRGNVVRSKQNYQAFLDDPKALVIYSGIHSPPLIKNRSFINENKALTLVPWAAGGPITRYPSKENWVFRLSIDDTQAGKVIVDFARNNKECKNPHLLLESTPWGDSNLKNMTKALEHHNIARPDITRFNWNIKENGSRQILTDIKAKGNDCILLVANAIEGTIIVNEMTKLSKNERLPIISHWGITGGNFHKKIPSDKREGLDLYFIQSCFAFTNKKQNDFAKQVFEHLKAYSEGSIKESSDLQSAVGFIHAYDLTRLLIEAIKQSGLTGDINKDRNLVRLALENLNQPIQGLVKKYKAPFSIFSDSNINAHEALDKNNFCMGKYGKNDEILIEGH